MKKYITLLIILGLVGIGIVLSVILEALRWSGLINISLFVTLGPILIEAAIVVFVLFIMAIFNVTHKN